MVVVGKQLLGVLWQTITAVSERRVVVVIPDARIKADALNDGFGIKSSDLGIGIEFVKLRNP